MHMQSGGTKRHLKWSSALKQYLRVWLVNGFVIALQVTSVHVILLM